MVTLVVNHKVKDFDTWLPHFEKHADARKAAGCKNAKVFRAASDPNNVTVMFEVSDPKAFEAMGQDPEFADVLKKSGVIGQPTFSALNAAGNYPF